MLRTMLALILGLYLFIVGLVTFVAFNAIQQQHQSRRNTLVLCALRENAHKELTRRAAAVRTAVRFLHDNPRGVTLGRTHFSRGDLVKGVRDDKDSLANEQRVVDALDLNNC